MDVERTALPGIGLRHVFITARGRRIGTISHRDGRRDLLVYDREDPDTCVLTVPLTAGPSLDTRFMPSMIGLTSSASYSTRAPMARS